MSEVRRRVEAKRMRCLGADNAANSSARVPAPDPEANSTEPNKEKVLAVNIEEIEKRLDEIDKEVAASGLLNPLPSYDPFRYRRHDQRSLAFYESGTRNPYHYRRKTTGRNMKLGEEDKENKFAWLRYAI